MANRDQILQAVLARFFEQRDDVALAMPENNLTVR